MKTVLIVKLFPQILMKKNVTNSLVQEGAKPIHVSKNLAELKSVKISKKIPNQIVLGADSVIDLEG